ncbi:MAG: DUF4112 domain-containing protein [Burkholderiales bacterium]|nr:DUF4112 domain-containing protein [Phycisphaerae bacterium]
MMEATRVNVRRVDRPVGELAADIQRARAMAKLMDSQFEVAGVKFGMDSLIGLLPVAGDAVSFAIGLYPILIARKHGLGRVVVGRMLLNLGVDFLAGAVPVVGDVVDVMVKANLKNVELLERAAEKRDRID